MTQIPQWVINEVGENAVNSIYEMLGELYECCEIPSISFRFAPSVICRNECEMFAISHPRFAIRANFEEGFVNLRRLPRLGSSLKSWSSPVLEQSRDVDQPVHIDSETFQNTTPRIVIEKQSRFFADSMLTVPEKHADRFDVIQTSLHEAYGEVSSGEERKTGTPFVQHLKIAGGLCAQAVCFMVSCLLHRNATNIDGIVEISIKKHLLQYSEASRPDGSDPQVKLPIDFPLSGMRPSEICTYLNSVGFSTKREQLLNIGCFLRSVTISNRLLQVAIIQSAMRNYLRSGVPIVALVNVNKLGSFYSRVLLGRLRIKVDDGAAGHAMLIIGAAKYDNDLSFLCNDPRSLPFQEIDANELLLARTDSTFRCIPVLPSQVSISLLDSVEAGNGLLSLIALSFTKNTSGVSKEIHNAIRTISRPCEDFVNSGNFRLVKYESHAFLEPHSGAITQNHVLRALHCKLNSCVEHGYYWIQYRSREHNSQPHLFDVIVWKARDSSMVADSTTINRIFHSYHDVSVNAPEPNSDRCNPIVRLEQAISETNALPSLFQITPSVISSCFCLPFEESISKISNLDWGKWKKCCDAYVFMNNDLLLSNGGPAEEFMAENADKPEVIEVVASKMIESLILFDVSIVAMASFLPGLSSNTANDSAPAIRSLIFLAKLANSIYKSTDCRQHIRSIEIVAGSRATGIWPAFHKSGARDSRIFASSAISTADARRNLISNLKKVVEAIKVEQLDIAFRFAIELEPGPLFSVGDPSDLVQLVTALTDAKLDDYVGVNLDIAHWKLCRIKPSNVRSNEKLFNAIAHAHLSGHFHLGHFGDVEPFLFDPADNYSEWISLLNDRLNFGGKPFSGVVSLEQEVTKDLDYLRRSHSQFLSLFS